jgi:hypothetical protein
MLLSNTTRVASGSPVNSWRLLSQFTGPSHSGNPRGIHFDGADGGESTTGASGDVAPNSGDEGAEGTDAAGNDENAPRFTQKQLDEVLGRRLEQERRKWDREFKQKLDEALKARTQESSDGKERAKGKDENVIPRSEYDNLKRQLESSFNEVIAERDEHIKERDKQIAALLDEKRTAAIIAAVAPLSPVNAKQVATLVGDQVGFDEDGAIVVLGPKGQPRYGRDGNYLTVEDFMVEFSKANPHLFKAEVTSGSGSRGGTAPSGSNPNLTTSTAKIAAGLAKLRASSD